MKEEIEQLRRLLKKWNHEYYTLCDPTVPDSEYDRQFRRLQELEAEYPETMQEDSPTQTVGSKVK